MNVQDVYDRIKKHSAYYTTTQSKIANYILNHPQAPTFNTATELARKIGVSQPSLIRFAQLMGFKKYRSFKNCFESSTIDELNSVDRLNLSLNESRTTLNASKNIILHEIKTLTSFIHEFPWVAFNETVNEICSNNRIFIIGTRGSAFLAQYFAYYLKKIKTNVYEIKSDSSLEYDKLLPLDKNTLVVAISFPRYPRETIDFASFCFKRGLTVIGITDKNSSPLVNFLKIKLIVPIAFNAIFDSYCCALCLCNMLITSVGSKNPAESEILFREFENLAKDLQIFISPT